MNIITFKFINKHLQNPSPWKTFSRTQSAALSALHLYISSLNVAPATQKLGIITTSVSMSWNINHGRYVNCRVSHTMCWPWSFPHQLESWDRTFPAPSRTSNETQNTNLLASDTQLFVAKLIWYHTIIVQFVKYCSCLMSLFRGIAMPAVLSQQYLTMDFCRFHIVFFFLFNVRILTAYEITQAQDIYYWWDALHAEEAPSCCLPPQINKCHGAGFKKN